MSKEGGKGLWDWAKSALEASDFSGFRRIVSRVDRQGDCRPSGATALSGSQAAHDRCQGVGDGYHEAGLVEFVGGSDAEGGTLCFPIGSAPEKDPRARPGGTRTHPTARVSPHPEPDPGPAAIGAGASKTFFAAEVTLQIPTVRAAREESSECVRNDPGAGGPRLENAQGVCIQH
jgi:hypothetical protein